MDVASFYRNVFQKSMVILLNRPSLEFIGILSYGAQIKIASIEEYAGKVSIPSLAFTDGESITIMAADELSPKQVAFIIFHEIWNILNFHPSRCGTRDPVLWNLCVDHVTNRVGKEYSEE